MVKRITILLAVVLLLVAVQVAWSFDANSAANGYVTGPVPGSTPGTYTSTWTVEPLAGWESGWLMVSLEFQPDGGITSLTSVDVPSAGWDPIANPVDGWIGWYLTEGEYLSDGLTSAMVHHPGPPYWTATYTTAGYTNAMNYHIKFAHWNESSEKWTVNQLSKTAGGDGEVPEPASLILLTMGLTGTVGMIRRKRAR